MSPFVGRLMRLVLRAYPTEFRRSYGEAMVQSIVDRHRHQGVSWSRLVLEEFFDATRVAPQMRWESPMNRIINVAFAAAVLALVGIAISPLAAIPLAAVMIAAAVWWARQTQPIDSTGPTRRWSIWLVAGLVAIAGGVAIPAIDRGELSETWWTVFAAALLAGTTMTIVGVVLALSGRSQQHHQPAS